MLKNIMHFLDFGISIMCVILDVNDKDMKFCKDLIETETVNITGFVKTIDHNHAWEKLENEL